MIFVPALFTAAVAVNGLSIPHVRDKPANSTTLAYIGCVADDSVSSLTSGSSTTNAEARESCASTCLQRGGSEIAYFNQEAHSCVCANRDQYPSSGEIVYAEDDLGNCRHSDGASVDYIFSPYTLSQCYLTIGSEIAPSSNKTFPSPLTCLDTCTTEYLSIRPAYDNANDQFVYECSCWEDQVQGGQSSDCGFGIQAVYRKA
ncbi:hypothetical protein I307_03544 [Cryptococcus deuterogattii 99/473]|uniref:WSC domain-containing protein n=1 Tax=Cryptococcus deuterogattii Ram5 TaxID=1296110 RepID=A0A0D0VAA1_9TREE|nr:hypothetical protein I313_00216 [Cryptococcus deuterogattii Ram5]KIY57210.1 hypothetical protein I307_03544 [Cryptococcus deuterogattii 99/473]